MRKRVVPASEEASPPAGEWLDLESLADVEISSEDPGHPIEGALVPGGASGWRADKPGEQTIRLRFDQPQRIRRIHLEFAEDERSRTQEFVLRSAGDAGSAPQEIVRQQWNFSPGGAGEVEDYEVDLTGVTTLELTIVPDVSGGDARASLARLSLA